jgi:hypothetical protein
MSLNILTWDKRFQTNGGREVHPSALKGIRHPAQMKHVKHSKRDLDDNNYVSGCYC